MGGQQPTLIATEFRSADFSPAGEIFETAPDQYRFSGHQCSMID